MNTPFAPSIEEQVKTTIESAIPGAQAQVQSHGSHFDITVISAEFAGKGLLEKQRMVYSAIAPFMSGPNAPVHAVDRLRTLASGAE